jgi:hypothetical protein
MWSGMDPQLQRELAAVRQMVALRRQSPTREWPLRLAGRRDVLFVIREWPDGSITAYVTTAHSSRGDA